MSDFLRFAEDFEVRYLPFGYGGSDEEVSAVPASTTSECTHHFSASGGNIDDLVDLLNVSLVQFNEKSGSNKEITAQDLKDGVPVSHEFHLARVLKEKVILKDPDYCFRMRDDIPLDEHHSPLEAGPSGIWNLGAVYVPPWGLYDDGRPIRGNSVRSINSGLKSLESIFRSRGEDPDLGVSRFFDIVNAFVDSEYHINRDFLANPDNWVSYRYSQVCYEALRVASGDPDFLVRLGQENISKGIIILSKFFPVQGGYEKMAYFASKYTQAFHYENVDAGSTHAIIRMHPIPDYVKKMGRYKKRFFDNSHTVSLNTMGVVASKVYDLSSRPFLETGSLVRSIPRARLNLIPSGIDKNIFNEISRRIASGDTSDYSEFVYSFRRGFTGWKKVFKPLTAIVGLSSVPLSLLSLTSDVPLGMKAVYTALSLTPATISLLLGMNRKLLIQAEESEATMRSQQADIEKLESKLQHSTLELRRNYLQNLITDAIQYLDFGNPEAARRELEFGLRHCPYGDLQKQAISGLKAAVFEMELESDVTSRDSGAEIKAIDGTSVRTLAFSPDEDLSRFDLSGLKKMVVVKPYDTLEACKVVVGLSEALHEVGAPEIPFYFSHKDQYYVLEELVTDPASPWQRGRNLLEMHESGNMTGGIITEVAELGARFFCKLLDVYEKEPKLLANDEFMTPDEDIAGYFRRASKKMIGKPGSKEPFTQGLNYLVKYPEVLDELEALLEGCESGLDESSALKGAPAVDLSWKNMVRGAELNFVDYDRATLMPLSRYGSIPTEMGGVIPKDIVDSPHDFDFGEISVSQGEPIRADDLFFYSLIDDIIEELGPTDPRIEEYDLKDVDLLVRQSYAERFCKALSHFGSFMYWALESALADDPAGHIKKINHGLCCLDNAVVDLEDMAEKGNYSSRASTNFRSTALKLQEVIDDVLTFGLHSDVHIHGALSKCVAKSYGFDLEGSSNQQKLDFLYDVVDEKLSFLKGELEHVAIVEHFGVRTPGVSFEDYMRVFRSLKQKHDFGFVRLSFGLELDMGFDEHGDYAMRQPEHLDRWLQASDVVLLSIHGESFRLGDSLEGHYLLSTTEQYVDAMVAQAGTLASLKKSLGPKKIYVATHPWKCASEINAHNSRIGVGARIAHPSKEQLAVFYKTLLSHDINLELNQTAIRRGESDVLSYAEPIVRQYLYHARTAGSKARILFARDAHHKDDLELRSVREILDRIPELHEDAYCNM